jgi:hypothetical protein
MKHPFELNISELQAALNPQLVSPNVRDRSSAIDSADDSSTPIVTTLLVGEEGGVITQSLGEDGEVTTLAYGEEGGEVTDPIGEVGGVTTLAYGEEGGEVSDPIGEAGEARGEIPKISIDIITGSGTIDIFTATGDLVGNEHFSFGQF